MTDPLAGLRDIQLPDPGWPDAFAALAFGILIALAASCLLRWVAWRPPSRKNRLLSELFASSRLEPSERLQRQAEILKRVRPGAIPGLSEALYRREPELSPDAVERQLVKIIEAAPR